jgi:hypothetical protein
MHCASSNLTLCNNLLRAPALTDVARQRQVETLSLAKLVAEPDREDGSILRRQTSSVTVSRHYSPASRAIDASSRQHQSHALYSISSSGCTPSSRRPAIDVENDPLFAEQEKTVHRMVDEAAKPGLARAQLILGPLALGYVAHQA